MPAPAFVQGWAVPLGVPLLGRLRLEQGRLRCGRIGDHAGRLPFRVVPFLDRTGRVRFDVLSTVRPLGERYCVPFSLRGVLRRAL